MRASISVERDFGDLPFFSPPPPPPSKKKSKIVLKFQNIYNSKQSETIHCLSEEIFTHSMHTHAVAHLRELCSMATRFVRWRHGNVEEQQEQERKEQILSSI